MKFLFLIFTLTTFCTSVNAQVQRHDFTLTGSGGEAGTGFFTWDDTDPVNGSPLLLFPKVLSGSLTVTGGSTPAGSQTFLLATWTNVSFGMTPNFLADINIWADNGVTTVTGASPNTNNAGWGSILTFIPGATAPVATPVPTLSTWGLLILSSLMGFIGINKRNKKQA